MNRKDIYLAVGLTLIVIPCAAMVILGGPFNTVQWIGIAILLLLGFGFLVAGTPDEKKSDAP